MNAPENKPVLTIGQLATRTHLSVSAIRYYEQIGLIPPASRRPSGHRVYGVDAEEVLCLIRHCRAFGFSLEDTRALVSLASNGERDCVEARDIAQVHLDSVRSRLIELKNLERSLSRFVKTCTAECAGGAAPGCSIFKDIRAENLSRLPESVASESRRCCG